MRSKPVLNVVLAFGLAFAILAGATLGASVGPGPDTEQTKKTLGEIANDAEVDPDNENGGGLSADVTGDNEPTVVGVAISGGQFVVQLVAAVAYIPGTLMRLGFPRYFAMPVGGIAQIIAFIGLVQFVSGRELI